MVDEVEIVNVKGDEVASEETLLALLETMKKMATSKGFDPKEVNKKTKDLANNMDSLVDIVDDNTKALDDNTDAKDDNTDSVKRNTNSLASMAGYIAGSTLSGLAGFTGELITGGTRLQDFSQHIPIIGSLFNGLSGFLDDSIESFRGLSSVGAAFGNSITDMRMNAANMELTLGEMTDLISTNSETLRILGGSVTEGARRFAQLNKGLKDTGNFRELKEMGFTVQEINEGMLSYIDLQSGLGRLQRMDNVALQQGTAAYLDDLDELAKLTGKQRDEIAASMVQEMNDARVRAAVSRMTDDQAKRFNANLALISNTIPGMSDSFKNLAAGLPVDEISQSLRSIGGDAGNALADLFANAEDIDPTVFQERFSELAPQVADYLNEAFSPEQVAALMSGAGGSIITPLLALGGDLQKVGNMNIDAVAAEQSQRENITQTLATFEDAVRTVRAEIQRQLLDSGLFQTLADGISSVVNIFTNPQNVEAVKNGIQVLADSLDSFMTTFSTEGFKTAIIDSFGDIFNAIKTYFVGASADNQRQQATDQVSNLSTRRDDLQNREQEISRQIESSAPGSIGFSPEQMQQLEAEREAIRTQSNSLTSEIQSLETQLEGSFEDIPGVINGAIEGIIPAILGGIGNTLSTGIRDLFTGNLTTSAMVTAIAGLWASSKVVNAIGGISNLFGGSERSSDQRGPTRGSRTQGGRLGSNIGGALGGLTGGILEGVGNGLAAIGAKAPLVALGAATVGAAIPLIGAGLAGAAWIMGKALPTFAEGMESFEDVDGSALRDAALGMTAIAGAMAAFGAGSAVAGLGNLVGSITNGLASLFGGEDPMDQLQRFAEYDIDAAKVENNARAMIAFSGALAASGGAQAASGVGELVGGITSFLGGLFNSQEDPIEQLQRFARYDIDADKVIANANALTAFSRAMTFSAGAQAASGIGDLVDGLLGGLGKLLGAEDPLEKLVRFSNYDIDTNKVIANADALAAFSNALQNFPEIDSERVGGLFGAIGFIFSGKITMPWDRVNEFGNAEINVDGVTANAEAISAFSSAFANFPEIDSERVGGLFGAIGRIFSGKITMPWDQVNDFGNAEINATGVTENAVAISAFSSAFANFPEIDSERVSGLFASIRDIFGGETIMPWDRVNEFGNAEINATGVTENAEAMRAFSSALQNFPELDSERVGGLFGAIGRIFSGRITMPWDQVNEFSNAEINVDGVTENASAMRAFADALSGFSNFEVSELDIPNRFTNNLIEISNINGNGLQNIATGLESIVGVTGVRDQLDAINEGLDPAGIRTYADAIDQLVERLNELNEVLADSNDTLFNDNQSAAEVLGNINVSTQGSSEGIGQLNTLLSQMLVVLNQSKEIENRIERNTASLSSDTLSGRVSRIR